MHTRFLLGPSGSGKTFRCVAEARSALLASPTGPPLVFLAPKQATFQIERQLLADPSLQGYTRLRILSFERLAEFALGELSSEPSQLLSEEGRLMVLRALLSRKRADLKLFHATAHLPGFAHELSNLLRELEQAGLTPEQLLSLSASSRNASQLHAKLQDLAAILSAYQQWLNEHRLKDDDQLLTLATQALGKAPHLQSCIRIGALWLDGFAEICPQQIDFLLELLPHCDEVTLAFNLERESVGPVSVSWLSSWSNVSQSYRQLKDRIAEINGVEVAIEWLDRDSGVTRFSASPVLEHLESHWSRPSPFRPKSCNSAGPQQTIRFALCINPEAEATVAAEEIRRFVRGGGRFRDAAVLVRNLERYSDPVRRVFTAYEIPFFLDRREPVGHHPLSELTRSALRTVTYGWQTQDWFGALKTGLVHDDDAEIDWLENEALARGWSGKTWLEPLKMPDASDLEARFEPLRAELVEPFRHLADKTGTHPSGPILADALAAFWQELGVEERLKRWSLQSSSDGGELLARIHSTFWEQLQGWLENLALAFGRVHLGMREWLPIIEAGLGAQTVGVIPPNLDQVLVGAVDRSRNPDLRLALVLGLNESVFPAMPDEPNLLTISDREELMRFGVRVGLDTRRQLAREWYYGYIACTRGRERLVLTCSLRDEDDKSLNPSPFLDHLRRLFPEIQTELPGPLPGLQGPAGLGSTLPETVTIPTSSSPRHCADALRTCAWDQSLSPVLAECLYGPKLETSVSRLEEYAACPFRFFLTSGLRVEERKLFRLDVREQGSYQHEVLARFHQHLANQHKRWRDLSAAEAREAIAHITEDLIPKYQQGLLEADQQSRFTARTLTASLQDFIGAVIEWMPQYRFDPHAVELGFGIEPGGLPAWELDLGSGHRLSFRGRIDRVDLWQDPATGEALCVVIDYKSSQRRLDPLLLAHGIQLQLPAYLNVLRSLPEPEELFGVKRLIPAGVFYVNLRGRYPSALNRGEVLGGIKQARAQAYQHTGRFDIRALPQLDARPGVQSGDQFKYRLRKDGQRYASCREALDRASFEELIQGVEGHLERIGREIYAGVVKVDPYRKGSTSACDQCQGRAICRLDPWRHAYRVLANPL